MLLVMSVTRLSDGVCVACLDEDNQWVRPTRENFRGWRQLNVRDLRDAKQRIVVDVGNVVRWSLSTAIPRDVHCEDVQVAAVAPAFERSLSTTDLLSRCQAVLEPDVCGFLAGSHSLAVFRPDRVKFVWFTTAGKGGVGARIGFRQGALEDVYSVTDLRWRALGRSLLAQTGQPSLSLTPRQLWARTGLRIQYLAVGKGQAAENIPPHRLAGPYWPFFISVFAQLPAYIRRDYANL